jgi:hypothetical protein
LGLVLTVHAGFGGPQSGDVVKLLSTMAGQVPQEDVLAMRMTADTSLDQLPEDSFIRRSLTAPRRVLWQLIIGGAFDRYPNLRLVFTEVRADWVPGTIAWLDQRLARAGLRKTASEYWATHCYVTPSSPRVHEVAQRDQIGIDRFLFGMDYPHPEGTWPNTREWLGHTFKGVGEADLRRILGLNAIECFGLDEGALRNVAARIGLSLSELKEAQPLDERLIEQFHARSGYSRPPETFDPKYYENLLAHDEALVARS